MGLNSPRLLNLPTEILLGILGHLSNIASLHALSCSHPYLTRVVNQHSHHLVNSILPRSIPNALLPQALAAFEASRITNWTSTTQTLIAQRYRAEKSFGDRRFVREFDMSVLDALEVEELHRLICHFANAYVASALELQHNDSYLPLSHGEWLRVVGAIYRMELCAHLFRDCIPRSADCMACQEYARSQNSDMVVFLLSNFHLVEIEQMGSMAEYVFRYLFGLYFCTCSPSENVTITAERGFTFSALTAMGTIRSGHDGHDHV